MPKPRTAENYGDDITATSLSGLAELMTALGAYRDALVLIGGWAPFFILEQFGEPGASQADAFQADAFQTAFEHVGSIDINGGGPRAGEGRDLTPSSSRAHANPSSSCREVGGRQGPTRSRADRL